MKHFDVSLYCILGYYYTRYMKHFDVSLYCISGYYYKRYMKKIYRRKIIDSSYNHNKIIIIQLYIYI